MCEVRAMRMMNQKIRVELTIEFYVAKRNAGASDSLFPDRGDITKSFYDLTFIYNRMSSAL
jgi:hypothetical protein